MQCVHVSTAMWKGGQQADQCYGTLNGKSCILIGYPTIGQLVIVIEEQSSLVLQTHLFCFIHK